MSCTSSPNKAPKENTDECYDPIISGAMKNVMWNGELGPSVKLDTISNKAGLYGLGPLSYLRGELVIIEGNVFASYAETDSTMRVEKRMDASAPFFVYANVKKWDEISIPSQVKTIKDLEEYIDQQTQQIHRPFPFKISGRISKASIHIQNLPEGSVVSSPKEAHQGQMDFELVEEEVDIIGFFSTQHQGVFTHHDSFLHMHLMTSDQKKMGHLDAIELGAMTLYLPSCE